MPKRYGVNLPCIRVRLSQFALLLAGNRFPQLAKCQCIHDMDARSRLDVKSGATLKQVKTTTRGHVIDPSRIFTTRRSRQTPCRSTTSGLSQTTIMIQKSGRYTARMHPYCPHRHEFLTFPTAPVTRLVLCFKLRPSYQESASELLVSFVRYPLRRVLYTLARAMCDHDRKFFVQALEFATELHEPVRNPRNGMRRDRFLSSVVYSYCNTASVISTEVASFHSAPELPFIASSFTKAFLEWAFTPLSFCLRRLFDVSPSPAPSTPHGSNEPA